MSDTRSNPEFETLVSPYTGDISNIQSIERGSDADITAIVECERGPFFVKAIPNRPGGKRDSLIREGLINPFVQPISPAVCWQAEDDAWLALGFEVIKGRGANFKPGAGDLPTAVDLLNRIGSTALPGVAYDWEEDRWDRFTSAEESTRLRGDTLLFTDITPNNFMIGDTHAWAVDWAWPTRGAGFIDPACLVIQLIAAGHSAADAESWAEKCDAWVKADPAAIDVFVAAMARMYHYFAERDPVYWRRAMVGAVQQWADYRHVNVHALT